MKVSLFALLFAGMLLIRPLMAADLPAGAIAKMDGRTSLVVAVSPDGKTLASGGTSTIELWDATSGKRLHELTGHDSYVYSVAFSPDSKSLASGSGDGTIRVWEFATGKEVGKLTGHHEEVRSVCFSPDGKRLASGGADGVARLWDVSTSKKLREFAVKKWIYSVAFSPDGKLLALGSLNREIRLWDTATGEDVRILSGHTSLVYSVAFSPDGKTLASCGEDHTIRLWEVATGKQWCMLEKHDAAIYSLAFSRDGRTLASITMDGQIGLWEVVSQQHIRTITGPKPLLRTSVAFAPDGKTLAAQGGVFTVLLWDRTGRKFTGRPLPVALSSRDLEFHWLDLLSTDAGKADEALWALVDAPESAVSALNGWLKPVALDPQKVAKLIEELDSDQFAIREKATEELAQLGTLAELALQRVLQGNPSLEVQQRVEGLLQKLDKAVTSPEVWRQVRAVSVLEQIGTKESRALLAKLAGGAEGARLTQEAKAAMNRLGGGKP